MISTHLKHINQLGSFPQVGVNIFFLKPPPSLPFSEMPFTKKRHRTKKAWFPVADQTSQPLVVALHGVLGFFVFNVCFFLSENAFGASFQSFSFFFLILKFGFITHSSTWSCHISWYLVGGFNPSENLKTMNVKIGISFTNFRGEHFSKYWSYHQPGIYSNYPTLHMSFWMSTSPPIVRHLDLTSSRWTILQDSWSQF